MHFVQIIHDKVQAGVQTYSSIQAKGWHLNDSYTVFAC